MSGKRLIGVLIDERLDEVLRAHVVRRKGDLSKFVEEAIKEKLEKEGVKV